MSSCLILYEKNRVIIGADTALSAPVNNIWYRVSNNQEKLFEIKDSIIFCSGKQDISDETISFIKSLNLIDIMSISNYLKNMDLLEKEDIFNIELVICQKVNDGIKVYQISEYNNFEVIEHNVNDNELKVLCAGIKTNESLEIATNLLSIRNDVLGIYEDVYNKLSCNQIGGNLIVWSISDNIKNLYDKPIKENNIQYLDFHSVVGDVIVGKILAGNNLTITNENNKFLVDGSGATLIDATLNITNSTNTNQILLGPSTGIKIRSNLGGTWTDTFYADTSGNLHFTGDLSGATGTFSGNVTAATITGGTISGASISGTTINGGSISGTTGTFSGNIYAANLQGQVQDSQISSLNADKITAGTINAVTIKATVIRDSVMYGATIYSSDQLNSVNIYATSSIGGLHASFGSLSFSGPLTAGGSSGASANVPYSNGTHSGMLYFKYGVLYSWY